METKTQTNRWGDSGSDIMDDIRAARALINEIPPMPFLAMSIDFRVDKATVFKLKNRDYVCAHPDFWKKIPEAAAPFTGSMIRIEIVDIDADARARSYFFEAMAESIYDNPA